MKVHAFTVLAVLTLGLYADGSAQAAPANEARASVIVHAVQSPSPSATQTFLTKDEDAQLSSPAAPVAPVPVVASAEARTVPNNGGLGFAGASAFAKAEAGVLGAMISGDAQGVAQPTTSVGATAIIKSFAKFTDRVTFTAPGKLTGATIHVVGVLNLDGFASATNTLHEVRVGGSGFNPFSATAEWVGTLTSGHIGTQKSALFPSGPSTPWDTRETLALPFDIVVANGIETEIFAHLQLTANVGASLPPCQALGGLCNVVQIANSNVFSDFSHTLAWGGVSVFADNGSGPTGPALNFTSTSRSGFNYALPAPVPLPATAWLLGSAGLLLTRRKCRKSRA